MQELKQALKDACKRLFDADVEPELSRPDEKFGDYATNAALQLAKRQGTNPGELAGQLAEELRSFPDISHVQVAGPGFINFRLKDDALAKAAISAADLPKTRAGQEILVEFGDPNPFKEMHVGHVYSYVAGDAISSLLETSGAEVHRLSYHGDVGLHVAKAIWGMQKIGTDDISSAYTHGAKAYEADEQAKQEINAINGHVYKKDDENINSLYERGKNKSFEHFDKILNMLSISTEKRYFESQSAEQGMEIVRQNTGKVFQESEGAIVYEGEKAGLHTRVFLTSQGLPTYETKDLGLAELKNRDYPNAAQSIIVTAHEQMEYFKVMLAALAEINKPLAEKTTHLYHGFISLSTGKMSSRTGDVYSALNLIQDVGQAAEKQFGQKSDNVRNAAIKYGFLKHRLGSDIIYDVAESISLDGNSGPYLQYAHARACSILAKADHTAEAPAELMDGERSLVRKISEYPEVIEKAGNELMPHHICTYLYELAQAFNSFYEKNRVIGDERQAIRLQLVNSYSQVLKSGLKILNIEAPERI